MYFQQILYLLGPGVNKHHGYAYNSYAGYSEYGK